MRIVILRLGHRIQRDQRITTHVALTARALGAEGMLLDSDDSGIEKSLARSRSQLGRLILCQKDHQLEKRDKKMERWREER